MAILATVSVPIITAIMLDWKKVHDLDAFLCDQGYTGIARYWMCLKMISKILYKQYVTNDDRALATRISDDTYRLDFSIEGQRYILLIDINRDPSSIVLAYDGTGEDVTEMIQAYSGPDKNINNKKLTPSDMGFQRLAIVSSDGSEKTFEYDETVVLE
jgi:hypothetical protein